MKEKSLGNEVIAERAAIGQLFLYFCLVTSFACASVHVHVSEHV